MNKSGSIPRTYLSNKSNRIEKPSEIDICKDNISASIFSGHGESLSIVTPDTLGTPRKNKRKKTSDTSIIIKQPIKEPANPRKRAEEITLTDVETYCLKETPPFF